MGRATEQLAERMGEGIGGLLNATFGNAAELIIALVALRAGLHDVVKASIAGSIIGNILLVLGAAMLAGGLRHPEQHSIPPGPGPGDDAYSGGDRVDPARGIWAAAGTTVEGFGRLRVSLSIVLLVVYLLFLLFTLVSHSGGDCGKRIADGMRTLTGSPPAFGPCSCQSITPFLPFQRTSQTRQQYAVTSAV